MMKKQNAINDDQSKSKSYGLRFFRKLERQKLRKVVTSILHKIAERVLHPLFSFVICRKKVRMTKKSGKEPEERQLFHGTNPNTVKAICQQGFDWRMCGKNGTAYGKGSYFASNANYSHCYSNHGVTRGTKQMFLAKVLVGSFTAGDKSLARPPPKDSSNPHVLYDSCCDNTANPALFVVFENGQSYPEFLITYT